jgi:hypothetical protein
MTSARRSLATTRKNRAACKYEFTRRPVDVDDAATLNLQQATGASPTANRSYTSYRRRLARACAGFSTGRLRAARFFVFLVIVLLGFVRPLPQTVCRAFFLYWDHVRSVRSIRRHCRLSQTIPDPVTRLCERGGAAPRQTRACRLSSRRAAKGSTEPKCRVDLEDRAGYARHIRISDRGQDLHILRASPVSGRGPTPFSSRRSLRYGDGADIAASASMVPINQAGEFLAFDGKELMAAMDPTQRGRYFLFLSSWRLRTMCLIFSIRALCSTGPIASASTAAIHLANGQVFLFRSLPVVLSESERLVTRRHIGSRATTRFASGGWDHRPLPGTRLPTSMSANICTTGKPCPRNFSARSIIPCETKASWCRSRSASSG